MAGLDEKVSFVPAVEKEFGKENVIVVKDAQGAQPISRWYRAYKPAHGEMPEPIGDLYDRLMKKVQATTEGYNVLGERFAQKAIALIKAPAPSKCLSGDDHA